MPRLKPCLALLILLLALGLGWTGPGAASPRPGGFSGLVEAPPAQSAAGFFDGRDLGLEGLGQSDKTSAGFPGGQTSTPSARAANVPLSYATDPRNLVRYLTFGISDGLTKAKTLHDWIVLNISYDVRAYFTRNLPPMDASSVFSRRSAVCAGYANLYAEFCRLAGLQCEVIVGVAKGYTFVSRGEMESHAWNAVGINNRWLLVDTTWDAGYVNTQGAFVRSYGSSYFFLDPSVFIHTHYPNDSRWQLLARPVSRSRFDNLALLYGSASTYGLTLLGPVTYRNTVNRQFTSRLRVTGATSLLANVTRTNGAQCNQYGLAQREGTAGQAMGRFPGAGDYLFYVFARRGGGQYSCVLIYRVHANSGSAPFPTTYSSFGTFNGYIYSPLEGQLPGGSRVHFRIRLDNVREVMVMAGSSRATLSPVGGNVYDGNVVMPRAGVCYVYALPNGASMYSGVVGYTIR